MLAVLADRAAVLEWEKNVDGYRTDKVESEYSMRLAVLESCSCLNGQRLRISSELTK